MNVDLKFLLALEIKEASLNRKDELKNFKNYKVDQKFFYLKNIKNDKKIEETSQKERIYYLKFLNY